ncbi:ABC transporter ATP-binding protein [Actinosynnema sp. NPDC047251]|uniref:ABC-type quaternary amine transporter n=1 Tax=Saccharothrix espanaensis (strain ATCC 51144 / DSM 44229 / JCM 9112 / NBRC 15066 / NRRL 15764) TaxID=1179773 RepID=K0JWA6_SACES|nr:ABC transporter ATP-binding protein [Saccharothrix espanaensis]CCH29069.1 putative 2-aminoethylphosphonate ABC transporter, ATPase subunit [Saccharothrix espanaensis DSM 44229]
MTPAVELRDVSVHFGRTVALRGLDLSVAPGETLALLGPSGSGKSTALKAVAGFLRPTSGRVLLGGRDVTDEPPNRRGLGVVVQSYALFPHMKVVDNVAFGLRARRVPRRAVAERVAEVLALVGMTGFGDRYPRQLSGGQQQRVAIARALAIRPPVLLLDEPLSALDAALREEMVAELLRLRAELPDTAVVYVTHDQGEALALADRIAVMRDARLVEVGATPELYHRPAESFTASFLGASNLLPVEVVDADTVRLGHLRLAASSAGLPAGGAVALGVRPHRVGVRAVPGPMTAGSGQTGSAPTDSGPTDSGLAARLLAVQWRGTGYRLDLELDLGHRLRAEVPDVDGLTVGTRVEVSIPDGCPLVRVA